MKVKKATAGILSLLMIFALLAGVMIQGYAAGGAANTYTVTFYEYNNMVDEVTVNAGETVAAADIPATDTGRYWAVGFDKTAIFDENYVVNSDLEVYSYQGTVTTTYTVTFYEYNSEIGKVTVNAGETVAAADIPAADTGRYWAVGFDKTAIFDENYVVNSDLEIYSYKAATYTVTFYEYNSK
ncbi:MAG: hypothetical protein LUH36_05370, partial [Oscillospiraceae bacterium]|nr:hypothetical protein [Oscillospiraceae bacterium]